MPCARPTTSAMAPTTRRKRKYGGMDVSEARRLRTLQDENARLKRIIADLSVQSHILKEVNSKNGKPVCKKAGCPKEHGERRRVQIGCLLCAGSGQIRAVSPSIERVETVPLTGSSHSQHQTPRLLCSGGQGGSAYERPSNFSGTIVFIRVSLSTPSEHGCQADWAQRCRDWAVYSMRKVRVSLAAR